MTIKKEWYKGAVYHVTVRGNRRNNILSKWDFLRPTRVTATRRKKRMLSKLIDWNLE